MADQTEDEAAIRASIEHWAEAVRQKDADRLMRDYTPDVLVCDLMPPLQYVGAERYRQNIVGWFEGWQGPIGCEIRVERLLISGDLAVANCLTHNQGTQADGRPADFWLRATVVFRKMDGAWKVVHEHASVPFHMETFRPALDLQP